MWSFCWCRSYTCNYLRSVFKRTLSSIKKKPVNSLIASEWKQCKYLIFVKLNVFPFSFLLLPRTENDDMSFGKKCFVKENVKNFLSIIYLHKFRKKKKKSRFWKSAKDENENGLIGGFLPPIFHDFFVLQWKPLKVITLWTERNW
jgi:hypothetical protein